MIAVCMALIDDDNDKKAFETLYNSYKNLMMHVAREYFDNDHDAEDAVSAAFLNIAKSFHKVHKFICPKTAAYYVKIVRNTSMDIIRKKSAQNDDLELLDNIPDSKFDDFAVTELVDCISRLKPEDRDILHLYYVYGYNVNEIAKMYGLKENAVYKRLWRAKNRLMNELREDEDKDEQ